MNYLVCTAILVYATKHGYGATDLLPNSTVKALNENTRLLLLPVG